MLETFKLIEATEKVWGMCFWHTLGRGPRDSCRERHKGPVRTPLVRVHENVNKTIYLYIVADEVRQLTLMVYVYDDDYSQHENASCHNMLVL